MKAVLFDLDGTLLPMDTKSFEQIYFTYLAKNMALRGYEPKKLVQSIWDGTMAMVRNDGSDSNENVFWKTFTEIYGPGSIRDKTIVDEFYTHDFSQAKQACGSNPMAAELIGWLKGKGIGTALATNPIFPETATLARIEWAGLKPEDFAWITTYENSRHAKPSLAYYEDCLEWLGLPADQVLMVGNDVEEDMIAEKLGMKVFLLTDCLLNKKGKDISKWPNGSFLDLKCFLEKTIGRLNE